MLNFTIKTKKHRTTLTENIKCVDNWTEVTVKHWLELSEHAKDLNMVRVFSVFSGLGYDMLMNSHDNGLIEQIHKSLGWFYDAPENFLTDLELPTHVICDEYAIPIPKNLGEKTIGQKLILSSYLENKEHSFNDLIPIALAIYLEPEYRKTQLQVSLGKDYSLFTKEEKEMTQFDWERGQSFIEDCMNIKIIEAYPVARFFDQIEKLASTWAPRLKPNHNATSLKMEHAYELADHSRLDKLSDINIINNFAKEYNYSHEQVMLLQHDLVFSILQLNKERLEFDQRLKIKLEQLTPKK